MANDRKLDEFKDKLRRMCRSSAGESVVPGTSCDRWRLVEEHWFVKKAQTVRVPVLNEVVTVRRAIYAAFVGPIPEDNYVKSNCDQEKFCISPEHAELVAARGGSARSLNLSALAGAVVGRGRGAKVVEDLVVLAPTQVQEDAGPEDDLVKKVKHMAAYGATLADISHATGLSYHEIMQVRGGVYGPRRAMAVGR